MDLYRICGAAAGFGGPMRKILVGMLDEIGIHEAMSLHTSAELFDADRTNVIRASVLQHPVFVKGGNYTGYQPPAFLPYRGTDNDCSCAGLQGYACS